jgi:hypothetical protein
MTADAQHALEHMPEYHLVSAIIHQAYIDLRPSASPHERALSIAFFGNQYHYFEWLCDLGGLEYERIQAAVVQHYPGLFEGVSEVLISRQMDRPNS